MCSNLLREPQVFDQLGDLAGGIARDLIIWAAWNGSKNVVLHLPQFCDMMQYHRSHLLRKISDAQVEELRRKGWHEDDIPALSNSIGYALGKMATQLLLFAEPKKAAPAVEGTKPKYVKKSRRYTSKRMVDEVEIAVRTTGTIIKFTLDNEVFENSAGRHLHYQTLSLTDYLSLKTPKGHADDQARKVYLRMLWKRQYWDAKEVEKGVFPTKDSYEELLWVAGLHRYQNKKLAASLLRKLLVRVGKLPSVLMKPTVAMNYTTGEYELTWTRTGPNPKRKPAKLADAA